MPLPFYCFLFLFKCFKIIANVLNSVEFCERLVGYSYVVFVFDSHKQLKNVERIGAEIGFDS